MGDSSEVEATGPWPESARPADSRSDVSRAIMSAAAAGIVAVDQQGVIRFCNPAAGALFARPTGELVGTAFGFPLVPDEATEIDLMMPGGGTRTVEMRVTETTIDGPEGRADSLYIAALRDVTQQRRAERELQACLQQHNVAVTIAAHALHSPLTAISALVHILRDQRSELDEIQRTDILDQITRSTERLRALVRKYLTASRIDTTVRASPEPVPVLLTILELLAETDGRYHQVDVSCSPDLKALVDPGDLSEMLANYLENAFAYGRLPITVRAQRLDSSIRVTVCDSGRGVSPEFAPQLFERYSRAPDNEQTDGTGLGLWIVRNLAHANGGEAWYEPNPGGGACFCLRLRRATEH